MKEFQASILTCNSDDMHEIGRTFNVSEYITTDDLMERVVNLTRDEWLKAQPASWNNEKSLKLRRSVSHQGFCFTFPGGKTEGIYKLDE